MRKFVLIAVGGVAALAILGELVARFGLGLGSPVLYEPHPSIEYLLRPGQDTVRFGNRVQINEWGMRSPPIGRAKASPEELRILVFGDSVINGLGHVDQGDVATSRLQRSLAGQVSPRPVSVLNVSAGSWGPGNWLAYLREYGAFHADVLVLVISAHDASDNPTFGPIDEAYLPTRTPPGALWEGMTRYLPRVVRSLQRSRQPPPPPPGPAQFEKGLSDLEAFLTLARSQVPEVLVLQFAEHDEAASGLPRPEQAMIREVCERIGVPTFDVAPAMRRRLQQGKDPFRDFVHPNAEGHRVLAEVLEEALRTTRSVGGAVGQPVSRPPPGHAAP